MPRTARAIEAGTIYHVLNRGNGRMTLFHKDADFKAFERVLAEGLERYPVDLLAWCLMGNHWHLVLRPGEAEGLGRLMSWVGVTHVRRHHAHYHTRGGGHLYQGRFKSFPVQDDRHLLTVCRYVEANPLRAGLVDRAESWQWSSLWNRLHRGESPLKAASWPVRRPARWTDTVNQSLAQEKVEAIRAAVNRGRPYGDDEWITAAVARLGLEHTLREAGRPRKRRENNQ